MDKTVRLRSNSSRRSSSVLSNSSRRVGLHSKGNVCNRPKSAGVWQQHRATNWQSQHRTWQQRGGYDGYRIPDDRFRGYFGSGHAFRIYS